MATITKVRRLVNPGRKKRLTPLQKLFFGTKRQRAAVARNAGKRSVRKSKKAMRVAGFSSRAVSGFAKQFKRFKRRKSNAGMGYRGSTPRARKMSATGKVYFKRRANGSAQRRVRRMVKHHGGKLLSAQARHLSASWAKRATARDKRNPRRRRNVGSIITVFPKKRNPARRKRSNRGKKVIIVNKGAAMATRRRRKTTRVSRRRVVRRRRRNYGTRAGRAWSTYKVGARRRKGNPGRRRRVHNRSYHRRHLRRRNPGMLTGTAGRVLGVIGGMAVTKLICGFLPAQLSGGVLGYISTGAVAVLQGRLVGKFSKSPALGNDMLIGGLAYLAAKVLNDFFPAIGTYTGISGMGMIGSSSFYNPQVNLNGNMGRFVVPAATVGYVNASMPVAKGVGSMRRTGRLM